MMIATYNDEFLDEECLEAYTAKNCGAKKKPKPKFGK